MYAQLLKPDHWWTWTWKYTWDSRLDGEDNKSCCLKVSCLIVATNANQLWEKQEENKNIDIYCTLNSGVDDRR